MTAPTWAAVLAKLRAAQGDERAAMMDRLGEHEISDGDGAGLSALEWLPWAWSAWGRGHQQMPAEESWETLFLCCGRGGGKTRTGAELTIAAAWGHKIGGRLALVAPIYADIAVVMVEGPAGILARSPPWFRPTWKRKAGYGGELHWPSSPGCRRGPSDLGGVIGMCFTAEKPQQVRGPEFGWVWGDEIAKWDLNGGDGLEVLSNIDFACRGKGLLLRAMYTSTPKPTPLILSLAASASRDLAEIASGDRRTDDRTVILRRWSTYENAENLGEKYIAKIARKYAGSTKGREEIDGEILTEDKRAKLGQAMRKHPPIDAADVPELVRIIIAVDNASEAGTGEAMGDTLEERSREVGRADTGMIALGQDAEGVVYILDDLTVADKPEVWGNVVVMAVASTGWLRAPWDDWAADAAVVERNAGGAMIHRNFEACARDLGRSGKISMTAESLPVVYTRAKKGKQMRAEPIITLYEQGRVRHVRYAHGDPLSDLEFQMTKFYKGAKGWKKDRVDALVWGVWYLAVEPEPDITSDVAARFARWAG